MPRRWWRLVALVAVWAVLAACGRIPAPRPVPAALTPPATPPPAPASPFALRGVVEGFYAPPWSVASTLQVLAFMGAHGMNTFVYAPKFDPYQRAQWQQPYPAAQLQGLQREVTAAKAAGVHFVYSLSPGNSITYSSPADRAALLAKIGQLADIGVHRFMLSFDDLRSDSLSAADAAAYPGGLGQAQVALTNFVLSSELPQDPHFQLLFTPTEYWGVRADAYTRSLAGLSPAIRVLWTGPGVVSPQITLAEARAYGALIGREPVLWYNYPVNDWTAPNLNVPQIQPRDLFMGPVKGLAPNLAAGVQGVLANPMLEAHASEIPLASLAAYLRDPSATGAASATGAWQAAVVAAGGRAAAALLAFCQAEEPYPIRTPDYSWSSTDPQLDGMERSLLAAFRTSPAAAMRSDTAASLQTTFQGWLQAPVQLAPDRLADPLLGQDIAPWVRWMPRDGEAGLDALSALRAAAAGAATQEAQARSALRRDQSVLSTQPVQFGGNLAAFVAQTLAAVQG